MKRFFAILLIAAVILAMPSCNSDKTKEEKKEEKTVDKNDASPDQNDGVQESPVALAQAWCDLNGKVFRATTEEEKATLSKALEAYEKLLEDRFKSDEALMKAIEAEVEKCEDASEGR